MIREFMQSLVAAEVSKQLAEQEQRQVASARLERRPGSWPLATPAAELAAMVGDGRLGDVTAVAKRLSRLEPDCSTVGWREVPLGFQAEVYLTAAAGEAISRTADPPGTLRRVLAQLVGLLDRDGAPSGRVQPRKHNARWPAVIDRREGFEVVGQIAPKPDGSTFLLVHLRGEACPVWVDGEERFA